MASAAGIFAVIRCGREQGMEASAFGGEERALVRQLARRGKLRIVRQDREWVYATLPDPTCSLCNRRGHMVVVVTMRDGLVIGAMGCEPRRFLGLDLATARIRALRSL